MEWTALGAEVETDGIKETHVLVSAEAPVDAGRTPLVLNLVLDRSGSMRGAPLAAAMDAAQQLADASGPSDFLGLVVFDAVAEQRVPLMPMNERGKRQLAQALGELSSGRGTALHQAIELAKHSLNRLLVPGRRPKILLLTDGEPSVGPDSEKAFAEQGRTVAASGVSVHALGLGRHYLPDILGALTLPSENGFEHVDGPDGLPVAMGAVQALLFGEVGTQARVEARPTGLLALGCLHAFPAAVEANALVVSMGSVSRGAPRRVLLRGAVADATWELEVIARWVENGDTRQHLVPLTRVTADSPEGRQIRGIGLELELVQRETVAWLSLAQRDPERALNLLQEAELALNTLTAFDLPSLCADRHADRLRDLRTALERGEGDIPMLVRRARAASAGTHVSQIIRLEPHLKKH